MDFCIDDFGRLLGKDEINELSKTHDGQKKLKGYARRSKVAFVANQTLRFLDVELGIFKKPLTYEQWQDVCNVMYYTLFDSNWEEVEKFLVASTEQAQKGFEVTPMGNA